MGKQRETWYPLVNLCHRKLCRLPQRFHDVPGYWRLRLVLGGYLLKVETARHNRET